VVDFNNAHPDLERPKGYEAQGILELAATCTSREDEPRYLGWVNDQRDRSRKGLQDSLKEYKLDAFVFPGVHPTMSSRAGFPQVSSSNTLFVKAGTMDDNRSLYRSPTWQKTQSLYLL
jgi:amidase